MSDQRKGIDHPAMAEHKRNIVDATVGAITAKTKDIAIEALTDLQATDLRRLVRDAATAVLRSPGFAAQLRELVRCAALDLAREILAEAMPDLEARVRALVAEQFDKSVAAAAHVILDEKLSELRRKLT